MGDINSRRMHWETKTNSGGARSIQMGHRKQLACCQTRRPYLEREKKDKHTIHNVVEEYPTT